MGVASLTVFFFSGTLGGVTQFGYQCIRFRFTCWDLSRNVSQVRYTQDIKQKEKGGGGVGGGGGGICLLPTLAGMH